jgi:hypothetical protein
MIDHPSVVKISMEKKKKRKKKLPVSIECFCFNPIRKIEFNNKIIKR